MFTTAYAKRRVAADVHWLDSAVVMPRSLRQCSAYRRSCPKSHLLFNKNHLSNCQRTVVSEASPRRDLSPRLSVTRLSCLIDGTYYSTYADSTQQYFSKIFFYISTIIFFPYNTEAELFPFGRSASSFIVSKFISIFC